MSSVQTDRSIRRNRNRLPPKVLMHQGTSLLKGGKITAVETPGALKGVDGAKVVDAQGKWVIPGCVDLHVHLREPGEEWKETVRTGAEAAVLGGYTAICCMPNTKPAMIRLKLHGSSSKKLQRHKLHASFRSVLSQWGGRANSSRPILSLQRQVV